METFEAVAVYAVARELGDFVEDLEGHELREARPIVADAARNVLNFVRTRIKQ